MIKVCYWTLTVVGDCE